MTTHAAVSRRGQPAHRPDRLSRFAPALGAYLLCVLTAWAGIPWVPLAAAMAAIVLVPVARTLSLRVQLWGIAMLAAGGVVSVVPGFPINLASVLCLLGAGLAGALFAAQSSDHPALPSVPAPELLVLLGACAVLVMLAWPIVGAGPEDVLVDLARGADHQSHYTMVANIVNEHGTEWPTGDGSPALWANYYPLGLHALWAAALLLTGTLGAMHERLAPFAIVSVVAAAYSATALGWVSTGIARSTGPTGRRAATVAGGAFLICAPLGGLVSGIFEVGHVAFLVPAATVVCASWLAGRLMAARPGRALALLATAGVGVLLSYPPLLGGLIPVLLIGLMGAAGRRARLPLMLALGLLTVTAVSLLLVWRPRFTFLATAGGEFSTPIQTALLMTLVAGILALLASGRGLVWLCVRAIAAPVGFCLSAGAIGVLALSMEAPVMESYYFAKLMQAVWIGSIPVILGLGGWAVAQAAERLPRTGHLVALGVGAALLGLGLALVPDGRYPGTLGGVETLRARTAEGRAARGQTEILTIATALGPSQGDATVVVEPRGWFLPVGAFVKFGRTASEWLTTMRGVTSIDQQGAATCMAVWADSASMPCLKSWLSEHPGAVLTIVVSTDAQTREFAEVVEVDPERVRIVRPEATAP